MSSSQSTETRRDFATAILSEVGLGREHYIGLAKREWPDKEMVAATLADVADTLGREYMWPPASRAAVFGYLARFGVKVGEAESPEQCVDAFAEVLVYLRTPEPGWG